MSYHKKIEIWGDLTITVCDYTTDGEPVTGVIITSHSCYDENQEGASFDSPQCIYVTPEEIPLLIKALQEFEGEH